MIHFGSRPTVDGPVNINISNIYAFHIFACSADVLHLLHVLLPK